MLTSEQKVSINDALIANSKVKASNSQIRVSPPQILTIQIAMAYNLVLTNKIDNRGKENVFTS